MEAEIEPLVSLVLRGGQVVQPLFFGHGSPLGISLLVPPNIVDLDKAVQNKVHAVDTQQLFVASSIERSVICT